MVHEFRDLQGRTRCPERSFAFPDGEDGGVGRFLSASSANFTEQIRERLNDRNGTVARFSLGAGN